MNKKEERIAKKKSAVITTVISAIVLSVLFLLSLEYYDPPIENVIAINFGYDEEGMGKEEPYPVEGVAQNDQTFATENTTATTKTVEEKILTQKNESPVVKPRSEENVQDTKSNKTTQNSKSETQNSNKTTENAEKPKLDGRLGGLRGSLGGKGKNASSGDGSGSEKGNQGILEGDPNANNYEGTIAKGTRKLVNRPSAPNFDQCPNNEYGKLVVTYKVNALGKVIPNSIGFNGRGTNITVNTCIKNSIKKYLSKFRYSKSNKASEATSQTFNLKPR